jgi:tRNA 2-thiocytidine biosynthesis protein TtcA
VAEGDLARWAQHRQFPIIPCTLCGSQDNLQRVQVKKMIYEWERQYPGRIDNLFHAMTHVTASHMLDRNLYPFEALQTTGAPVADGDKAFDDEPCAPPVGTVGGGVPLGFMPRAPAGAAFAQQAAPAIDLDD